MFIVTISTVQKSQDYHPSIDSTRRDDRRVPGLEHRIPNITVKTEHEARPCYIVPVIHIPNHTSCWISDWRRHNISLHRATIDKTEARAEQSGETGKDSAREHNRVAKLEERFDFPYAEL
jgi:hypothetical protein